MGLVVGRSKCRPGMTSPSLESQSRGLTTRSRNTSSNTGPPPDSPLGLSYSVETTDEGSRLEMGKAVQELEQSGGPVSPVS